jgi:hypothetical protein
MYYYNTFTFIRRQRVKDKIIDTCGDSTGVFADCKNNNATQLGQ